MVITTAACSTSDPDSQDTGDTTTTAESSALNALLPDAIRSDGVLRVGVAPEFKPVTFYPPGTTDLQGSDPELLKALGAKLGVKVEFTPVGFDGLITGVTSGRFDIAVTGITDNAERREQVSFVDYVIGTTQLVTTTDNPGEISSDLSSVCGKRAGIQRGTSDSVFFDAAVKHCEDAGLEPPESSVFTDNAARILSVQSGRVDFVFYGTVSIPTLQEQTNNAFLSFLPSEFPVEKWGLVVGKDTTELQQALLKALMAIQADGTYDKILAKWKISDIALAEPGINGEPAGS